MRDDFSQKTKDELAKRVGYKCSNPQCRKQTIGANGDGSGTMNVGEAAHICAAAPGGKRYDSNMSSEERASIDNGIWLCRNCAAMIDRDEQYFSVEMLKLWKNLAEIEANQNIISNRNFKQKIQLSVNDRTVVANVINKIEETTNTIYMIKEHDYHIDFQRNNLDELFSLLDYLELPSTQISNYQLKDSIISFHETLSEFRCLIALKGGPSRHGNGSFVIDLEEDQVKGNELSDLLWQKYCQLMALYRMFD